MTSDAVLTIYTIYDHPTDFPHNFVVRAFDIVRGTPDPIPTGRVWLAVSLRAARTLVPPGLHRIARSPGDDAKIVESWI